MNLKFYLLYVLLAIFKKPSLMSEHRGRDPTWFCPLLGENAGSDSGAGDVAEG